MKHKFQIIITAAAVSLMAIPVVAQYEESGSSILADSGRQGNYGQMRSDSTTQSQRNPRLKNQVDRQKDQAGMNSRGATADDQSNKASDIDISKRIRSEIVAHKELSMAAHNVKIITVNGQVTLKGQVKNQEERRIISEIATGIVGANEINNQLRTK